MPSRCCALLACAGLWFAAGHALAAESYDNCTGFVDSLPATIATQGTWCLRKDLSTAMTSGNAITIANNNVTLDCNGFKVGGLAAGSNSLTVGVRASGRSNATVRRCAVRGFIVGIQLDGEGGGHLVEDNRLDNNYEMGIHLSGGYSRTQRNRVLDTGGRPGGAMSIGIGATGDILDNTVAGVFADYTNGEVVGIWLLGHGSEARDNQVRDLAGNGSGTATGLLVDDANQTVAGNRLAARSTFVLPPVAGVGIANPLAAPMFCTGNTIAAFAHPLDPCIGMADNLTDE